MTLLSLALACGLPPGEEARLLQADYLLDRPRVLAITLDPPEVLPDRTVTVDALVLAPPGHQVVSLVADVCALGRDFPTRADLRCFEEPEQVLELGALPAPWDVGPVTFDGFCSEQERTCGSSVPLLVSATADDGTEALGALDVWIPFDPDDVPEPSGLGALRLTVDGAPEPGARLALTATLTSTTRPSDAWWYVDAGRLVQSGVTEWSEISTPSDTVGGTLYATSNALGVPADHEGPLRIVALTRHGVDARWVVEIVDVTGI